VAGSRSWSSGHAVRWTGFVVLCLIAAGAVLRRLFALTSPRANAAGNPQMAQLAALDAAFASRSALTLIHIVPALLFVLLLPWWFMRRVRLEQKVAHKRITAALFVLGAITGLTALPLSLHPVGGINEAAATVLFDGLFLFSLGRAYLLWRRGQLAQHRAWMTRAIAVLLGIAATRPVMGVFFATAPLTHLQPQQFFGTAFWIGFTTTYIAGEAYLRAREARWRAEPES
jgi:hypothetical protein